MEYPSLNKDNILFQVFLLYILSMLILGCILLYQSSMYFVPYAAIFLGSIVVVEKTTCGSRIKAQFCDALRRVYTPEAKRCCITTIFAAFIFCVIVYGFLFSNEFYSHDSLVFVGYGIGKIHLFYVSIGRFLIPVYEVLKGPLTAPWLVGLLFIFWMVLTNFLIINLLEIKHKIGIILTCGLLCANVAFIMTGATYIYCLDEYALALLLSTASTYLFCKHRKYWIFSILFSAMSLSIYQAYFTVSIALYLLWVIKLLTENYSWKKVVADAVQYLVFLAASFLLYMAVWSKLCILYGVEKSRVSESLLSGINIGRLFTLLWDTNKEFIHFLFSSDHLIGFFLPAVHFLLLIFLFMRFAEWLRNRELAFGNRILLLLCFFALPTILNCVSIILLGATTELTQFALGMIYILLIFCTENRNAISEKRQHYRIVVSILLCCVLWNNIVLANQVYIKKDLEKSATISLVTRVIDRIEQVDGYIPDETPVAFVGQVWSNPLWETPRSDIAQLYEKAGLWENYSVTYDIAAYLINYFNYPINLAVPIDVSTLNEVNEMPAFPAQESIKMLDGILVVKLG